MFLLALAQVQEPGSAPPRLRFGAGLVSGASTIDGDGAPTLLGLEIRLGAQLSDRFALMYQGSATLEWPQVCSAAIAEWTVTRNLGVGIGAALDWLASVPNGGGGRDQAWIVGVPLRMGVYFPTSRNADAGSARSAWSFSWSLTPGYAFAVQGFGTGLALVAMAGISYELY